MSENSEKKELSYPIDFAYAKGKYIYFRYLREEDARGEWHLWFNAPQITHFLSSRKWINTPEDQLEYLRYLRTTKDRLALAIVDIKTDKHIGVCSLGSIDTIHRNAEMSCVIGNRKFQTGNYALEALAMITEIGFGRLNLHKIFVTGLRGNQRGLELTKLLGYKECGVLREHCFIEGEYMDMVILELFQKEWLRSPKRPKNLIIYGFEARKKQ